jgi:signal peptide peptidase SppA
MEIEVKQHSFRRMAGHWQMHHPQLAELVGKMNAANLSAVQPPERKARPLYSTDSKGVATIPIVGVMTDYPDLFDDFLGCCPASTTVNAIETAEQDAAVKVVDFYIDSPGGLASAGGTVAQAIAGMKKATVARVGGMAASAAYRAASQADKIVAARDAQVGSIGTYTVLADTTGLQENIGVRLTLVASGPYKGLGADGKVSAALTEDTQREITEINDLFVADVKNGRGLSITHARELADGRVWIASAAKSLGLIDTVESSFKENNSMNAEQFKAYAAENPDSAEVKALFVQGHKAGVAEATTEARKELKAMLDACPSRQQLAVESFLAGRDIETTKAMASAADAAAEAKDVEIAKLKAELAKANFNVGSQGAVGTGGATAAAADNANKGGDGAGKPELVEDDGGNPTLESAKAVAGWEWDNNQQTPAGMASKEKYVNFRCRVLTGQIRISRPA